jgi:hypothetical protein
MASLALIARAVPVAEAIPRLKKVIYIATFVSE